MGYFSPNIEVGDVKKALIEAGQYIANIQNEAITATGGTEVIYWKQEINLTEIDQIVVSAKTDIANNHFYIYIDFDGIREHTIDANTSYEGLEKVDVSGYTSDTIIEIIFKTTGAVPKIFYFQMWGMEA